MSVVEVPVGIGGVLGEFAATGVVLPADIRVALALGRLAGEGDEAVLLAAALTVRALRLGSVCVDLHTVRASAVPHSLLDDVTASGPSAPFEPSAFPEPADLPWPEPVAWLAACRDSPMVATEPPPDIWHRQPRVGARPLFLHRSRLYLDRYAQLEQLVRTVLQQRTRREPPPVESDVLRAVLDEVFGAAAPPLDQRLAVAAAVTGWVTVVAGGPGTGKTTTVGSLLTVLERLAEHAGQPPPRVAVVAPTGKAAARLTEQMPGPHVAQTVHRLLGARPWSGTRFDHDWQNRLPYDVVVVDETSMVSLELMARLLETLPTTCRVVLVGDPDQLASVDAGAVLADLVERPARTQPDGRERLLAATVPDDLASGPSTDLVRTDVRRDLVRLRHNYRAERAIAALGEAIRGEDADAVVAALRAPLVPGEGVVEWLDLDPANPAPALLAGVRDDVAASGVAMVEAARRGDATAALQALGRHRLLCAHRSGRYGVAHWRALAERWIGERLGGGDGRRWGEQQELTVGRPLLVTDNDRVLGLWNGDTGVVVAAGEAAVAAFDRGANAPLRVPVHRLPAVQTPLAMTVHKAQGSEAERVTVVLPPPESPLLTRELLYTAVTRAKHGVRILGTEPSVRGAVRRRVERASGLRDDWE